jgi:hypothetical protein
VAVWAGLSVPRGLGPPSHRPEPPRMRVSLRLKRAASSIERRRPKRPALRGQSVAYPRQAHCPSPWRFAGEQRHAANRSAASGRTISRREKHRVLPNPGRQRVNLPTRARNTLHRPSGANRHSLCEWLRLLNPSSALRHAGFAKAFDDASRSPSPPSASCSASTPRKSAPTTSPTQDMRKSENIPSRS